MPNPASGSSRPAASRVASTSCRRAMRGSMRSGRRVKFSDRAVSFAWKQRIGGILSTVLAIRCLSGRVFTLSFPAPKRSEALNLKPGDHILDIGPGWGAWLERSRRSAAICVFRAKWFGRSSDRRLQLASGLTSGGLFRSTPPCRGRPGRRNRLHGILSLALIVFRVGMVQVWQQRRSRAPGRDRRAWLRGFVANSGRSKEGATRD